MRMRCGPAVILLALLAAAGPALAAKKHHAIRKHAAHPTKPHEHAAAKASDIKPTAMIPASTPNPDVAKPEPALAPTEIIGIPPAERLKIQSALYWSGDYANAAKNGGAMEGAIRSFQKRNKSKITGVLTSEQRAELVAAADNHEREFGWSVVVDPSTGMRIGLPTKLVPNTRDAEHGTRWSSPHGDVQVETFRIKDTNLSALFEEEKRKASRTIERSALNNDNFIISGMQGLKLFTVRAEQRDGETRGFTLLYDQMMEGIVAPVMVAMASAFSPFPDRQAPFAALAKKVEYGTGLIVSAEGHILTARRVTQGCQVIVADGLGNAERIAKDEANGLALLRVYGAHKLPALRLTPEAAKRGDITLVGIPDPKDQDGTKKLTEIKAKLSGDSAIVLSRPVPIAGFAGAAALDSKGQFAGIMETRNFTFASVEPTLPPMRLISVVVIRDFLEKQNVPLTQAASQDARAATIRIICVRK